MPDFNFHAARPLIDAILKNIADYDVLYKFEPDNGYDGYLLKWKRGDVYYVITDSSVRRGDGLTIENADGDIGIDFIGEHGDIRDALAQFNFLQNTAVTLGDLGIRFRDVPVRWSDLGRQSFRTWFELVTGTLPSDDEQDRILARQNIRRNEDGSMSNDIYHGLDAETGEAVTFQIRSIHLEWEEQVND